MNRFMLAHHLNHGDELVWIKKYKDGYLRCLWRRSLSEYSNSLTFVAQHCSDSGRNLGDVFTAFTIQVLEESKSNKRRCVYDRKRGSENSS